MKCNLLQRFGLLIIQKMWCLTNKLKRRICNACADMVRALLILFSLGLHHILLNSGKLKFRTSFILKGGNLKTYQYGYLHKGVYRR